MYSYHYIWYIIYHTSYIIYHTSYIIHHISYIIYHTSYIINHISYIIHHTSYIIYHISYSFVIVVYRMLDTPTPQSHPLLRWQLQRVLSPALIVLLGRLSTRTARHGLATIATCLAHGVTRPADQELRRTKLRLLRTGGVFSKDSWGYKSCLLLVIYGSRWVLPSWNYRPPIFGVTSHRQVLQGTCDLWISVFSLHSGSFTH